jgi:all-trans-retinol 13,14-reductase
MVVNHYLHGAAYPTGGAAELARRIIPTVEHGGGAVLVNAPVRSIIVDELGAAAVRLMFLYHRER